MSEYLLREFTTIPKALVIAEDPAISGLLEKSLRDQGLEVFAAGNDRDAMRIIGEEEPPLIFVDWQMPGLSGVQFCQTIGDSEVGFFYIIMITDQDEDEHLVEAFKAGVDDYICKPLRQCEVLSRVTAAIRIIQLHDSLQASTQENHRYSATLAEASADLEKSREIETRALADRDQIRQEMARHVGMTDIAEHVTGNVSNALADLITVAAHIQDNYTNAMAPNIEKVAGMISEHAPALGEFLSEDDKGKLLPEYVSKLAAAVKQERGAMGSYIIALLENINKAIQIVEHQKELAHYGGSHELVPVTKLIEDALRIDEYSYDYCRFTIIREYGEDVGSLFLDKYMFLQVLVSLINNAKHALLGAAQSDRRLTLKSERDTDDQVKIIISDNGMGIAPENMIKLFQKGFSTKDGGLGNGLHSSALAIKVMGGTLQASSDGRGCGATFTIAIPSQACLMNGVDQSLELHDSLKSSHAA